MRTLLRSIRSGEYLESPETWTALAGDALDFQSVARALDLVRRRGLRDMELVLVEDPARPTSVAVEKLRLSPSFQQNDAETEATERKPRKKRAKALALATRQPARRTRKTVPAGGLHRKLRSVLARN